MANIQNVKLGNDIPNKLMSNDISDPGTEGKELWSWYKYANDAGASFRVPRLPAYTGGCFGAS